MIYAFGTLLLGQKRIIHVWSEKEYSATTQNTILVQVVYSENK